MHNYTQNITSKTENNGKEQMKKAQALYSTVLSDKKAKKVFMQLPTEDTAAYTSEVAKWAFFF